MAAEAASARLPLSFALTPTTCLVLHNGSIVDFRGDVIVSPTNEMLYCDWYGASGAIMRAAGRALVDACAKVSCPGPSHCCKHHPVVTSEES